MKRPLYAALGLISVALGLIGVFVPGLPTTVFIIAASYLFTHSSPRLERWLEEHPWFGPPLRRFKETRGMPARSKMFALLSMWAGISLSLFLLDSHLVQLLVVSLGLVGTTVILAIVRTTDARQPLILS